MPDISELESLTWRRMAVADAAAWADLLNAISAHDDVPEFYDTEEALERILPREDLLGEATLAVFDGDLMVGYSLPDYRPPAGSAEQYRIMVFGGVRPEYRRRGIGRRLLRAAVEDVGAMHRKQHPDMPYTIDVQTPEQVLGAAVLFGAEGFEAVRYTKFMRHQLGDAIPAPTTPEGMIFEGWSEATDAEFLAVRNEAFADHWAAVPSTPEMWRNRVINRSFQPRLSYLLRDSASGTAAGMLVTSTFEADTAATGLREAHFALIATRRAFRRRGVAGALIARALAAAAEAGFDFAGLSVDAANPTGAFGVYQGAGFAVSETFVRWGLDQG